MLVLHRFNSPLMVQPHLHALLLDGVYTADAVFHPFQAPDEAHLKDLAERMAQRVVRVLERPAENVGENDSLAQCTRVALTGGRRTRADDEPFEGTARKRRKLAVNVGGFNLEATTTVDAKNREALEQLGRYLLRGPLALDRLHINDDGNAEYELRRPDRHDRTTLMITSRTQCTTGDRGKRRCRRNDADSSLQGPAVARGAR